MRPIIRCDIPQRNPRQVIIVRDTEEMTVTLVQPYDFAWPSHFEQIESFLRSGLADLPLAIEHVGSTAVLGMTAKPIIDIDIVIAAGSFPAIKEQLAILGYLHQGDLGIPQRDAFDLQDPEAQANLPDHHLYVCQEGVYELRKHLAFRDFMRCHSQWRQRLNQLKQELCVKYNNDRQAYIDGKASMVEEITKLAMDGFELSY